MKLIRWAAAGASAYVVYKYAIGKKAKGGEAVFTSPEDGEDGVPPPARESAAPKKRRTVRKPKG